MHEQPKLLIVDKGKIGVFISRKEEGVEIDQLLKIVNKS